ncbi:MAG: molecular chaperone HtpG, partial [Candidatus Methanomethylophilaceae archaeon]|nr:molecular chaperone HtpG [Candidatus Methanomethylophilaceae archaeon]
DNGIGMNKEEMDANLGVIAHSGSLDFKKGIEEGKDVDIIGQFGVGFYSSFLVSDKVTVISKKYGEDQAWQWTSEGVDGYTIKECEKDSYGTDVIMHIREDDENETFSKYLDDYTLEDLIKKYSDYVRWPIHMNLEKGAMEETGEMNEDGTPKKEWKEHIEDTIVNSMVPIWQRDKSSVTDDDCKAFYKEKFHDYEDPISVIRVNAEGSVSYKAMLFIPKVAPYNFYSREFEPGLQLYSSGVMIMDKCKDLLPDCFRFVKGVVDSPDLSLNISREMLQHDRQLSMIRSNLEKKIKNDLERILREDRETYEAFHKNFGPQLKYGIVEDWGARADLLKDLIMFHSMEKDKPITLAEYVADMKEGQDKIYFASAESVARAKQLPQAEQVRDKGYDIICLTEELDEFTLRTLRNYNEKEFCDINSNDLDLNTEEEKKEAEAKEEESKELIDFVKESLNGKVDNVILSRKLKTHAVCLSSEGDVSFEMEKYFANIPGSPEQGVKAKRVLEINPNHPAFDALKKAFGEDKEKAASMASIMLDQALLMAGMPVEDMLGYSENVFKLF